MICGHLRSDGTQCGKRTNRRFHYHGDNELYCWSEENETCWVVVPFCKMHEKDHKPYNPKEYRRKK